MNNKIILLDSDDVILIGTDTFQVRKLKQVIEGDIKTKWNKGTYNQVTKKPDSYVCDLLRNISLGDNQYIPIKEIEYKLSIQCQVLKIGSKGWETGQIKINISVNPDLKKPEYNVNLEFFLNENIEPPSPLDDLRQIIQSQ
ncbi:KGK domain-containing protein [Nostoc parmelioides]|uniref:KGK domain-containing protein n=1 Tax=Nostoc parmelioides FACHB-3921 TaxID=2692909 RepID=A0ABR8BCD0_9NOSO|nr:KGK domain-containing protein [Nostoc parmelioides]MBD2251600.1 KGK domain-containing protein [Nostoc parmelioides FACHB-3921]